MRMSLTYMSNHVIYKEINVYMPIYINNQTFFKHAFKGPLCSYLTSTGFTTSQKTEKLKNWFYKDKEKLGEFSNKKQLLNPS